mmetsp:Transcript_15263/g.25384  ORF Transcript_15263/g.25384 Transcript_15263/m.25384 type:complete len:510 (+) Transcript_15263:242-1771(+)
MERPTFAQNAHGEFAEGFQFTNHAVTATVLAGSAGIGSNRKLAEQNRVASFENFWIGNARIGTVCVDTAFAYPGGSSAGSAGNGFVVSKVIIAKGQVVHATLRGGASAKCLQNHVHDTLRCQDVSANDASIGRWVQKSVFRNDEFNRSQTALIERNILIDEGSEGVNDCRVCDSWWRVVIRQHLRTSAGKVKDSRTGVGINLNGQTNGRPIVHVIDSLGGGTVRLGKILEHFADGNLGIVLNECHVGIDCLESIFLHELVQESNTSMIGSDLRSQVTQVVAEVARSKVTRQLTGRFEDFGNALLLKFPIAHQLEGHNHGTLIFEALGMGWHGTRSNASNIGMMTAGGDEEEDFTLVKDRSNDCNIWQMTASRQLRMIRYQHITFLNALLAFAIPVFDLKANGRLHGSQMNWNMWGVGHQSTIGRKESAGKVESFLHIDGNGRPGQRTAHLFGNAHETVRKDGELDGVFLDFGSSIVFFLGCLRETCFHSNIQITISRNDSPTLHLQHDS